MLEKQLKLKIAYGSVAGFVVLYAVAVLIYLGVRYGAGAVMSNLFGVACICVAFVCVTAFSYFLTRNYHSGKGKRNAAAADEEKQTKQPQERKRIWEFVITGICLAIAAFLVAWAVTGLGTFSGLGSILGDGYIKTRATVVQSVSESGELQRLVYEYTAADGTVCRSLSEASFGGIILEPGRYVTVYYSVADPRIAATLSVPLILLSGALMFFLGGIAFAIAGGSQKQSNLLGVAVFTFFALFGIMFYAAGGLASGLNVLELCLSGAAYYGITTFMLIGILLDVLVLAGFIKRLKDRKSKKI